MVYYVNQGTQFGKTVEFKTDGEAMAYAMGYAHMKDWNSFNLYNRTEKYYITENECVFGPELAAHLDYAMYAAIRSHGRKRKRTY